MHFSPISSDKKIDWFPCRTQYIWTTFVMQIMFFANTITIGWPCCNCNSNNKLFCVWTSTNSSMETASLQALQYQSHSSTAVRTPSISPRRRCTTSNAGKQEDSRATATQRCDYKLLLKNAAVTPLPPFLPPPPPRVVIHPTNVSPPTSSPAPTPGGDIPPLPSPQGASPWPSPNSSEWRILQVVVARVRFLLACFAAAAAALSMWGQVDGPCLVTFCSLLRYARIREVESFVCFASVSEEAKDQCQKVLELIWNCYGSIKVHWRWAIRSHRSAKWHWCWSHNG